MRRSALKTFDAYIDGDGDLRRDIFAIKPASQQVVFQLFSHLDQTYYSFFLFFSAIPSTAFWDLLLVQLAAVASGSARNRNFCEDYESLPFVHEIAGPHGGVRDKTLNLVGASHALWWELADPRYDEQPNSYGIWSAVCLVNPSRMVWEWWFEAVCREAETLWRQHQDRLHEPHVAHVMETWAEQKLGLRRPRTHWQSTLQHLLRAFRAATAIKHRIATPYLRIVYTIAKTIAAYNQPGQFFDTYNIAVSGLMRSIAKYAPSMSMAFSNFADREIRYEVYYQIGNYNIVTLPHKTWQRHREFECLKKQFYDQHKRDPSLDELISYFKLNRAEVFDVYQQIGIQNPQSLDQQVYAEERTQHTVTLKDKIEDLQFEENQQRLEDQELLALSLRRMSLQDRKIFIAINNLCDIAQDLEPDPDELSRFFVFRTAQPQHQMEEMLA